MYMYNVHIHALVGQQKEEGRREDLTYMYMYRVSFRNFAKGGINGVYQHKQHCSNGRVFKREANAPPNPMYIGAHSSFR